MTLFSQHSRVWQTSLMIVVVVAVFSWLQSLPILADPDSFYHVKITIMNRDFGLLTDFPWTQNSLYKDAFIDHHFLYHVILTPFVSLMDLLIGIKVSALLFGSLSILAIIWLLKKETAPWPWLWLIVLITNSPLLFRLSLGKAPSLAIGAIFIAWYFIIRKKYLALFFWSWFFVWFYSVWPTIIIMIGVATIIEAIIDSYQTIKVSGATLKNFIKLMGRNFWSHKNKMVWLAGLSGLLAGIIINPYFPTNLIYLKQLFAMSVVGYYKFVGIGAEWYPWPLVELIEKISLPLLIWLLATLIMFFNIKKQTKLSWSSWLMTIIFFVYSIKARRQVEYLVPWSVISSAIIVRDSLKDFSIKAWWKNVHTWLPKPLQKKWCLIMLAVYLAIFLPIGLAKGLLTARDGLNNGFKLDYLQPASDWLQKNSQNGDIVFQTDWGTFPLLFYNNTHNYYLTGLDQTFMYEYNADQYQLWVDATTGKRPDIYDVAKYDFNAKWLLLEKRHAASLRYLNREPRAVKVYQDDEVIIYQL